MILPRPYSRIWFIKKPVQFCQQVKIKKIYKLSRFFWVIKAWEEALSPDSHRTGCSLFVTAQRVLRTVVNEEGESVANPLHYYMKRLEKGEGEGEGWGRRLPEINIRRCIQRSCPMMAAGPAYVPLSFSRSRFWKLMSSADFR